MEEKSHSSYETRSQSSGSQQPLSFSNSKDNVKVMIRVRPLNEREKTSGGHKKCVTIDNETTLTIEAKPDIKSFNYDFVGDENIEQETIFSKIARPIADACLEGYNGSIFAYGQTGAGKTFTIQGPAIFVNGEEQILGSSKEALQEYEKRGIMQRSFEYIYDQVDKQRKQIEAQPSAHFESLVRCSYLEIYNEQIMDLLDPSQINLHLREDIKKGVYVEGLQEEVVASAVDMLALIQVGAKNRHVGSTSMNKESSRSHSVLTTIIETKSMSDGGVWNIKTSRFHIIDLAGSERSKYTNAVGERLKEAGMINKSLSALGNVINSLVDISEGKSRHVHYRDSKLTFLLRDSLGGNSKTVIIANVSPSNICYGETMSTLKFAQRAKLIRNKAVINEDSSGTIQLLKTEISRLKKELAENEKMNKTLGNGNGMGQQCSMCKSIMGPDIIQEEDEEDELLINNISCCEDLLEKSTTQLNTTIPNALGNNTLMQSSGPLNEVLKQKFKNQKEDLAKVRKRVVHLEGLLSANLDNLSSQQKFYDHEIQKHQQQNKKLQQAVESFEKQCARDKMIIKFREDRINKLEQPTASKELLKDEQGKQIIDLKKEVQLWKEAADHNSQAAKLFAEKAELQNKLDQLRNEYKQSPDSLQAQMRSLTEMNESLNQYLKLYCEESKKEVENELSRVKLDYAERIEQLNEKMSEMRQVEEERKLKSTKQAQDLQDTVNSLKNEVERLGREYQKEKEDIERQNQDAIQQIKTQIEQISENKTEQEQELQMFKVKLIEKEQLFDREREKKIDLEKIVSQKSQEHQQLVAEFSKTLEELEQDSERLREKLRINQEHYELNHENERKLHSTELREREAEWDTKMRELESRIMAESSEKQMLEEQSEQLTDRIKNLEEENETIQQSIIYKDEQIKELESSLKDRQNDLDSLMQQLALSEQESSERQQEIESLHQKIKQTQESRDGIQSELQLALQDKNDLLLALNEVKEEIKELIVQREDLLQQISNHLQKIESQSQRITTLENEVDSLLEQIGKLTEELTVTLKNCQVEIEELSQRHSNEQRDLTEELIQKHSDAQKILTEELNQRHYEEKRSLIEELSQKHEVDKNNLAEELTQLHHEEKINLTDQLSQKHEEEKSKLTEELTQRHNEDKTSLTEELSQKYEEEQKNLTEELTQRHHEDKTSLTEELNQKHEEEKKNLTEEFNQIHSKDLKKLTDELVKIHTEQLSRLKEKHEGEAAKVQALISQAQLREADLQIEVGALKEELGSIETRLQETENALENTQQTETQKVQTLAAEKTKLEEKFQVIENQIRVLLDSHQEENKVTQEKHSLEILELTTKVEQLEIQKTVMVQEYQEKVAELESLIREQEELVVEIQETTRAEKELLETENIQLQQVVEQVKEETLREVERVQFEAKQEVHKVTEQLSAAVEENNKSNEQQLVQLIEQKEETLKQFIEERDQTLQETIEQHRVELEQLEEQTEDLIKELELRQEAREKELQEEINLTREEGTQAVFQAQEQIQQLSLEIQSSIARENELTNEIQTIRQYVSQIEQAKIEAETQSRDIETNLKFQILETTSKLEEKEEELQVLAHTTEIVISEQKVEIEELLSRVEQLEKEREQLNFRLNQFSQSSDDQIKTLQSQSQSSQKVLEQTMDQLQACQIQIVSLKEEHGRMLSQLEDRMTIITDYQNQVLTLNEQVHQLTERKNKLKSQIQASELGNHEINRKLSAALSHNQELAEQVTSLQLDVRQTQGELRQAQSQLNTEKNQAQSLNGQTQSLASQVSDLNSQITDLHTHLRNQQEKYQNLQRDSERQVTQLQQSLQDATKSLVEIELQLHQQKQLHSSSKNELTSEALRLQGELETLTQIYQEKEQVIRQYEEECSQYQLENQDIQNVLQNSTLKFQASDAQLHLCQQQLEENRSKIGEYVQHNQQLQSELKRSKAVLEDTVGRLNSEHARKIVQQELENSQALESFKQELESYKQHLREQNTQMAKLKQSNDEHTDMIKSSKDTMSRMVQKENELMRELEKNINEFREKQEKSKKRIIEIKDERDQLRQQHERLKKENENLKELVKLKDRQIEDQQSTDESDKQVIDKTLKENKDLRNQLTKREFEMRDLVRTLKFYSEEKQKLEKEIEKLNRENDQLIGHKNPSQKIQHHVKIKEENNKLREENFKLQEDLRKKIELIQKHAIKSGVNIGGASETEVPQVSEQAKEEMKKLRKENVTYQETINRVVDHILSQPGLLKAIGITDENNEKLMQQNGPTKVKKAMEIISLINNYIQSREREVKDLEREIKKYECRLDIVEKEKSICKQQLELIQQSSNPSQYQSSVPIRSPLNKPQDFPIHHQQYQLQLQQQQQQTQHHQTQHQTQHQQLHPKPSRLLVEGFSHNTTGGDEQNFKHSPSPIINMRQHKEKENVSSSKSFAFLKSIERELFGQAHRSGSGRRTTYISGNNPGQHMNINK